MAKSLELVYLAGMNEKTGLHPRNKHKSNYDFPELVKSVPDLAKFVAANKYGNDSIDFSNATAVMTLNSALLKHFYNIKSWNVPKNYLCPPIPGRADYVHQVADLLTGPDGKIPTGAQIKVLDVGVGANCVYPLIASREYGWSIVGSDIDEVAVTNAEKILKENDLNSTVKILLQKDKTKYFENIVKPDDFFNATICNPPFNSSAEEARKGTEKKNRNLGLKRDNQNFGGQNNELWCEGGEAAFILGMIQESTRFKKNVHWFSTLVSKLETLPLVYDELRRLNAVSFKTIDMAQGQKKSRIVAWTFTQITK